MVEQWKELGVERVLEEQINRIIFLFLAQEDAVEKDQKRGYEETTGL